MNKKNLPDNIHKKLKFAAVFLVFFLSMISIGYAAKKTEFSMLHEKEIANGKKFRIFVAQGNHDPMIPVGTGAKTTEKLKKYGYEVEYQEYEGGHEISADLLNKIYSWITKK